MSSFDVCAYDEFVVTTVNNKANYIIVIIVEEKELTANDAWEISKLLCYENFAP